MTLGDAHLDAKLFPHVHPFGTGSLRSEEGAGGMQQYAKSRLLSLEHTFRRSAVWSFWMLERIIKNVLYFRERGKKRNHFGGVCAPPPEEEQPQRDSQRGEPHAERGTKRKREDGQQDHYARLFGRVDPRHIPESTAWWRARQAELMAISDDEELGLMTGMVSHSN